MNSDDERKRELLRLEGSLRSSAVRYIAGVDEAGRGPLAGPVVAAAVVFPADLYIVGVDDSKKIAPIRREELFEQIMRSALSVGVGIVSHEVIDEINILNATFRAMNEAIAKLSFVPDHLLIDGNAFPAGNLPHTTVIGGDGLCFSIAAASIIAKVTRDRVMCDYDLQYPGYGFAGHKGYGTREHRDAIARLGYCAIHRRSFHLKASAENEHVTEKEDVCRSNSHRGEEARTRKRGI